MIYWKFDLQEQVQGTVNVGYLGSLLEMFQSCANKFIYFLLESCGAIFTQQSSLNCLKRIGVLWKDLILLFSFLHGPIFSLSNDHFGQDNFPYF